MRVLVTGHRGYVGGSLMPLLLEKRYQLRGVDADLFSSCSFFGDLAPVEEQIRDIRTLERCDLEGFQAVIHLAGLCNDPLGDIDPNLTMDINFHATVKLAEIAKAAGVQKFVFASSCSIYGAGGEEWLDEHSALSPVTPYARSKMLSEQELTRLADDRFCPVFLRAATAYGASPKLRFDLVLNNLSAWALTTGRVRLKSDGAAWRPLVHVEDLGRAFVAALEAPSELVNCRAFNVGQTSENYRVSEVAKLVEEAVSGSRIEFSQQVGADRRCYRVRCDRNAEELPHFRPAWTVKSGIEQLLEVLRRQPLSSEDFEGSRFDRKAHLLQLLERGIFDQGLRRKSAVP